LLATRYTKTHPPKADEFFRMFLGAVNVDGARTLFGLLGVKRYLVFNRELSEGNPHQSGRMKEQILVGTVREDKSKTLVGETLDSSCHSNCKYKT